MKGGSESEGSDQGFLETWTLVTAVDKQTRIEINKYSVPSVSTSAHTVLHFILTTVPTRNFIIPIFK